MSSEAIKNDAEYRAALRRVNELMDAEGGTFEGDASGHLVYIPVIVELETLVGAVYDYEEENYPIDVKGPEL